MLAGLVVGADLVDGHVDFDVAARAVRVSGAGAVVRRGSRSDGRVGGGLVAASRATGGRRDGEEEEGRDAGKGHVQRLLTSEVHARSVAIVKRLDGLATPS